MKKTLLIIGLFVMSLMGQDTQAQVTITQENYPRPHSWIDSFEVSFSSSITLPEIGANKVWNYANVLRDAKGERAHVDETNNTHFSDAINSYQADKVYGLGTITYTLPSRSYEAIDQQGWYLTGRTFEGKTVSLQSITGNSNDKVHYPPNAVNDLNGRIDILKFPLNYQDSWSGSEVYDLHFNVTVSAFNLNNVPAFTRKQKFAEREVVGYGKLTLPKPDHSATEEMDVLLVKINILSTDSHFLNGNPAPAALLNAFGLSQTDTNKQEYYAFYRPGYPASPLFFIIENGAVERVIYRYHAAEDFIGLDELDFSNSSVYPNPVSVGEEVSITVENSSGEVKVDFYDIQGRYLFQSTSPVLNSDEIKIQIPLGIKPGILFYKISDKSQGLRAMGKLEVF
ncbi:MAG: T9SS type A sorting domain-containing protein [Flavobacteriales bacterium]|jgi:hypothetical protein|nr:T9SS type A sorting domain-containing protein [Flavobacteriales bacterium]